MANQPIATIARRQHGVVARRQLLACGLTPDVIASRIRNEHLFRVVRSVYSLGPHVDPWGYRYAAVLAVDPEVGTDTGAGTGPSAADAPTRQQPGTSTGAVLSHWSAAQAHGIIPTTRHQHHVTLPGTGSRPTTAVQVHRARTLLPAEVSIVEGLRVTSPARTILDCAAGASVRQVRKLIREAEYLRLIGAGEMATAIESRPHHPGRAIVRQADPRTAAAALGQTPLEDRVAAILTGMSLPAAVPQHAVAGASGQRYRADFAWPDLRLIVEADGRPAHDRSTSFDSDRARDADLAAAGWITLRFTSAMLRDPARAVAAILGTARTRGDVSTAAA